MKKYSLFFIIGFTMQNIVHAQDTLYLKKHEIISTQSLLLLKETNNKSDSTQFKTPKYIQGFFCNFEDQLHRKKIPLNFSLGNSKY